MEIKVGYIIAYDYAYVKLSLPTVYKQADKIVLAIDKDRKTFTGQVYTIEPDFFSWLNEFDRDKKILLYEDVFYAPGLTVEELDTRKRNMLAKFMGEGGWHFQVDSDEYFVDFGKIVTEIKSLEKKFKDKPVAFRIYWRTIFKIAPEGYYLVDQSRENFPLATNYPVYETMRYNHSIENRVLNHVALHQSYGRTEEELTKKFNNWSHSGDFDGAAYLNFWRSVNPYNSPYVHEFHPTHPNRWMRLKLVEATSVADLLSKTPVHLDIPTPPAPSRLQNWIPPVVYRRLVKK